MQTTGIGKVGNGRIREGFWDPWDPQGLVGQETVREPRAVPGGGDYATMREYISVASKAIKKNIKASRSCFTKITSGMFCEPNSQAAKK